MAENEQFQKEVAHTLLERLEQHGFVLTGSSALREHGIISRPTQDVDLFTQQSSEASFPQAMGEAKDSLEDRGFTVEVARTSETFQRLIVTSGKNRVDVDFGIDYREFPPATMEIGPVLALEDSVASKISALYGRGLPRDFLDVDSIRQNSGFSDEKLLALAKNQDPGFEEVQFAHMLQQASRLRLGEVQEYGVSEEQLKGVQQRLSQWSEKILTPTPESSHALTAENTRSVTKGSDISSGTGLSAGQQRLLDQAKPAVSAPKTTGQMRTSAELTRQIQPPTLGREL